MVSILQEGRPLWRGPCRKVEIEEADVRPSGGKGSQQDLGSRRSGKQEKKVPMFSRMGAFWRRETLEVERSLLDRKGHSMRRRSELGMWQRYEMVRSPAGLAKAKVKKVLILTDSKAANIAVKKAGRTGKAISRGLQETVNMIAEIREEGGEVKLGWVKAHMSILGNEAADVLAKTSCLGGAVR